MKYKLEDMTEYLLDRIDIKIEQNNQIDLKLIDYCLKFDISDQIYIKILSQILKMENNRKVFGLIFEKDLSYKYFGLLVEFLSKNNLI